MQVAFYGDDFTGSTDALYQFHRAGLAGTLFLRRPTQRQLAEHSRDKVLGIAGVGRTLGPDPLTKEVQDAFGLLRCLGPRHIQYKVCSTFDSSPVVGSIGVALETVQELIDDRPVAIAPAQPQFGRYTVFGNHFAVEPGGAISRLDRHSSMSQHPTTPMRESDLRRHVAFQTGLPLALVDIRALRSPQEAWEATVAKALAEAPAAIVFDALEDADLQRVAELVIESPELADVSFGSGGLSFALGRAISGDGPSVEPLSPVDRSLVLAGSLAPQTRRQIAHAVDRGWRLLRRTPEELAAAAAEPAPELINDVLGLLASDHSVVVASSTSDPEPDEVGATPLGPSIGAAYARILEAALTHALVGRSAVAGGDTSGWTMRRLQAHALRVVGALDVAGAVCRLESEVPGIDGAEVVLKGGQVGGDDFFSRLLSGEPAATLG